MRFKITVIYWQLWLPAMYC